MSPIARRKYCKSARLVKPASCETLLSRTSTTRRTPASTRVVKNCRASFLVKPMVKRWTGGAGSGREGGALIFLLLGPGVGDLRALAVVGLLDRLPRRARVEEAGLLQAVGEQEPLLELVLRLQAAVGEDMLDGEAGPAQVAADQDRPVAGERVFLRAQQRDPGLAHAPAQPLEARGEERRRGDAVVGR